MTLVQWTSKNSRAFGKVGLYAIGGFLIGWPLIKFGTELYNGNSVEGAANQASYQGFGVDMTGRKIDNSNLRWGLIRTGLGAVAIIAAKKI